MAHLGQIIAVEQGERERTQETVREALRQLGEGKLLTGIEKRYRPRDEEDTEQLPDESFKVQATVQDALNTVQRRLTRLWDLAGAKENTNIDASADVIVDGMVLLENVPVTYLLFLERELGNLRDLIRQLPLLDPAVDWEPQGDGVYATEPFETTRGKKVPKSYVAYEATATHPAQVQIFTEDVVAGYWTNRRFSGALPKVRQRQILDRIDELSRAVRFAREAANKTEVIDRNLGRTALEYVFEI